MQPFKTTFFRAVAILLFLVTIFGLPFTALAQSTVNLQLHDIQVKPIQGSAAYDVSAYFSLLDSAGNPIKDATVDDFTLAEDNQPVKIATVAASNEPLNVAILLDTSGSMAGDKIKAARSAASKFIEDLQNNDQVAVLTFDKSVTSRIDFTLDHTAAEQQVELIPDPIPNAYTCLYDAAYESIQNASALPSGQRAIILLTDGKDEANNGTPCSLHTLDDVISLASESKTSIPIYTIGLGSDADTQSLQRMASETGGRYQASPDSTQLDALFGLLLDELRSQYVIHYTSAASAGPHTLTLNVNYRSEEGVASGKMEMPALPYILAFTSPVDSSVINEKTAISISITGQGAPIQKVVFLANNNNIGSATTPPYSIEWDPSSLPAGSVFLEAVAQDAGGIELARSGITITYNPAAATTTASLTPTPTSTSISTPTSPGIKIGKYTISPIILAAAGGVILLGIVLIILLIVRNRRKKEKERDRQWQEKVQGVGAESTSSSSDDRTIDSYTPSENALGVLVIQQSDDPAMLHQRIEIVKPETRLGRKADNDVIFANDSPVSRYHAVIEERNGQLFLSEIISADEHNSQPKRPLYGTFVNGTQVKDSVLLQDGDEIMLGKRVRIRFESAHNEKTNEDRTFDQGASSDDDKTMDFGTD